MNKFKKIVSVLAAAAMVAMVPTANVMEVDAAEPTTFYLRYDTDEKDWRMQINEWNNDYEGRELYYLNEGSEKAKDGDIVVVLPNSQNESGSVTLNVNAHLSNLTVNRAHVAITTKGIDECHVHGDSYAAITGDIATAYVYDNAVCTLHSNVNNLKLIATIENTVDTTVTVGGTVAYASTANAGGILNEYYNFVAGTFHYDSVVGLMTDSSNYSKSGSAPTAPAPATTTPAQGNTSSSGEYDDVPKTGESNYAVWLFVMAALCMSGSVVLRKTSN